MKKITLVLEILKIISEKGNRFVTTTEIHEELYRRGILPKSKVARKRIQRILNDLRDYDYLESKTYEIRGKRPQEWKINLKNLPYFISYSQEELTSLLTLVSFVPDKYRELPIFKPAFSAINRLALLIDESKREKARESFKYFPIPVERFSPVRDKDLKEIFTAIVNGKGLVISYSGGAGFEIFPLKVFTYNGVFYMSALKGEDPSEYRTYQLSKVRALTVTHRNVPAFYYKKFRNKFFALGEKPFLLRVELPADYVADFEDDNLPSLYATQFHIERVEDKVVSYIVAYTGKRFASWILFDEVVAFRPADMKVVAVAKEMRLARVYDGLSYGIKENEKRFKEFMEDVKNIVSMKDDLLSRSV